MDAQSLAFPLSFDVDFPDRELNRWTTAFRVILAIPVLIVLALLAGGPAGVHIAIIGVSLLLFVPTLLLILFRQKYPRWWFDFALGLLRFDARVTSYLFLLRDEYPSVDEDQAVHVELPYPDVTRDLNRWLPLVKWFLAIPHYVVLIFLNLAAFVVAIVAWFAILFTGRYPRGLFDFVVGVLRWQIRVAAYAFLLTTDRYPPFSLNP
jgi:Domain of unknown function (DUF4389)